MNDGNEVVVKKARTVAQRASDRAKIAELLEDGYNQSEIGEKLGIPFQRVSHDVAAIRAMWEAKTVESFQRRQEFIFRKIQVIEQEAWEAWEKSKEPRMSKSVTQGDTVNKQSIKKEERGGDPRYLQIAADCIDRYAKLFGVNVERVELSGAEGGPITIRHIDDMTELLQQVQRHKELQSGSESSVDG